MIGIADPGEAETALAAGTLACPGCTRPLHPWGHARTRTVRDHGHTTLALRPRRARCRTCRVTHVLLPAAATARRADTTAVIGSALLASARGIGYRRIAAQLDRPLSTVRRWIRAVRDPAHLEWLRTQGMGWLALVDLDVINTLAPQATLHCRDGLAPPVLGLSAHRPVRAADRYGHAQPHPRRPGRAAREHPPRRHRLPAGPAAHRPARRAGAEPAAAHDRLWTVGRPCSTRPVA